MKSWWLTAVLLAPAAIADEGVPPELALKVMLKVLSYDPAVSGQRGDFVVGIAFTPGTAADAAALERLGSGLELKTVNDRPLRFVLAPVKLLGASKPSAVLLAASLPPDARAEALRWARDAKVYSLALGEQAVSEGALLGVGVANGKPQPLINVTTARALGADFKAVLRLARAVQ